MSLDLIDMSSVPVPDVIEVPDFEARLEQIRAAFVALKPEYAEVLQLESEPINKLLELAAYREILLIQRINDSTRANILASAYGNDLEALASRYKIQRLEVSPGDSEAIPPVAAVLEDDEGLRRRVQLAFDGLNTAGSIDAYVYHALAADGRVQDAYADSPHPTEIVLTLLSREGTGAASTELLESVRLQFGLTADGTAARIASKIRPQGDRLTVNSAEIILYQVTAKIVLQPGPSQSAVMNSAQRAIRSYVDGQHRLGAGVTLSGIHRALHQPGAQNVFITSPPLDIQPDHYQAAYCTGITLNYELREDE